MEIGGHTDSQGNAASNLTLSFARAESVLAALGARGVDTSVYEAQGYGETQPIADNETPEGREANRRITFTVGPAAALDANAPAPVPTTEGTGTVDQETSN